MGYSASKNNTTLKTESDIVQDHWKWRRSIYDRQWLTNRKSSWAAIVNLVPFSSYLTLNDIVTLKSKLEVTQGHIKWYHSKACVRFPFAFHSNYGSIFHHLRDKVRYWSKIVIFAGWCYANTAYAVMRCVCVCVRHVRTFCQNKLIYLWVFSPSGSHAIYSFSVPKGMAIFWR